MDLSDFQKRVYDHVRTIPTGKVQTYGGVATAIGCPSAGRAVGSALKKNPFGPDSGCDESIIVNCHRVVPATRNVGGYFGDTTNEGQMKKRMKLEEEGVQIDERGDVCKSCICD